MYTSGDTEGALRYFLGLLKGSSLRNHQEREIIETDALYIGDFKVAFEVYLVDKSYLNGADRNVVQHLRSTVGENAFPADLKPPFSLSSAVGTKIRLARQDELDVDNVRWEAFEATWSRFWKTRGIERLEKSGKAVVGGQ